HSSSLGRRNAYCLDDFEYCDGISARDRGCAVGGYGIGESTRLRGERIVTGNANLVGRFIRRHIETLAEPDSDSAVRSIQLCFARPGSDRVGGLVRDERPYTPVGELEDGGCRVANGATFPVAARFFRPG